MAGSTRRVFALILAVGALCLTACGVAQISPDPQAIADTDAAFQELAAGNDKALLARLPKEVSENPGQVRLIGLMRQLLPKAKAKPYDFVGWRVFAGTGGRQHTVILRYAYDNGEYITTTAVFTKPETDGPWKMVSLNINPSSPEEVSAPVIDKPTSPAGGASHKTP